MAPAIHKFVALDIGNVRIGVAIASSVARLAHPYDTVLNDEKIWDYLEELCVKEQVQTIIVGLPRGLDGQDTGQTKIVRKFAENLGQKTQKDIYLQDEALTSLKAEQELAITGKKFNKGTIDALAATYILEDFLRDNPEVGQ